MADLESEKEKDGGLYINFGDVKQLTKEGREGGVFQVEPLVEVAAWSEDAIIGHLEFPEPSDTSE
jgi:hypothetical protein